MAARTTGSDPAQTTAALIRVRPLLEPIGLLECSSRYRSRGHQPVGDEEFGSQLLVLDQR
jgi:hypothetical protein